MQWKRQTAYVGRRDESAKYFEKNKTVSRHFIGIGEWVAWQGDKSPI